MARSTSFRLGAACGVLSAALFGASAPLAKLLLRDVNPVLLAGLLYLGGGIGLTFFRLFRRPTREASLSAADAPLIAGIVVSGGIAGPVLLLWGLTRITGFVGSLLLNLEGVFTVLLALALFGERLSRSEVMATAVTLSGAALITVQPGESAGDWLGAIAVTLACLSWAVDNNLTRRVSVRDPIQIVQVKTLVAGTTNVILALALGQRLERLELLGPALLVGFVGYGISIVLDVYALRLLGAAREAAFFAMAPFIGALIAIPVLGDSPGARDLIGGAVMLVGVSWLVRLWK